MTSGKPIKNSKPTSTDTVDYGTLTDPQTERLKQILSAASRAAASANRVEEALAHLVLEKIGTPGKPVRSEFGLTLRQYAAWLNSCRAKAARAAVQQPTQARFWQGQEAAFRSALERLRRMP